ncbi:hypothetical protein MASR1M104_10980 [Cloacibacterium normanense]
MVSEKFPLASTPKLASGKVAIPEASMISNLSNGEPLVTLPFMVTLPPLEHDSNKMENKNNKKYFFISLKKLFLFLITQKYTFSFICRKKLCVLGKF